MGTVAGILATAALSHLGGSFAGGLLARFGLIGFGKIIGISRHVLNVGKALRKVFIREPTPQARDELKRWLQEHDPQNRSGLGDGIT